MKNCCQQQDKSYCNALRRASCCTAPVCQKLLSKHIRLYCKKLIASRTNRIVMHRLRASYANATLSPYLLSEQIRSYCKKLITSWTNRIAMQLRRCLICRHLDKSDRIGIETCCVFHCAVVSSSDIS